MYRYMHGFITNLNKITNLCQMIKAMITETINLFIFHKTCDSIYNSSCRDLKIPIYYVLIYAQLINT